MTKVLKEEGMTKKITKPEVSERKTGGCAQSIDNYCITVFIMIYISKCLLNFLQELYALVAGKSSS